MGFGVNWPRKTRKGGEMDGQDGQDDFFLGGWGEGLVGGVGGGELLGFFEVFLGLGVLGVGLGVEFGDEEMVEVGVGEVFKNGLEFGAVDLGELGGFVVPVFLAEGLNKFEGGVEVFGVGFGELAAGFQGGVAVVFGEGDLGFAVGDLASGGE